MKIGKLQHEKVLDHVPGENARWQQWIRPNTPDGRSRTVRYLSFVAKSPLSRTRYLLVGSIEFIYIHV